MIKEIRNAKITHVSLVGKGANGQDFLIVKSDDAQPDVTWEVPIVKADDDKRLITGVVYAPDDIDSQGDFMTADEIEKTAHTFLAEYRNIDKNHSFQAEEAEVVESYVAKSDHEINGQPIKAGTWVMTTHIKSDGIWDQVKKGDFKGYSMGGTGTRVPRPDMDKAVSKASDDGGFFDVLERFVARIIKKNEPAEESKPGQDFAEVLAARKMEDDLSSAKWALSDMMRETLESTSITDKAAVIASQIDSYKAFVVSQINTLGVEKAAEGLKKEDGELTIEDITKAVGEALAPLATKLEKLEKEDGSGSSDAQGSEQDAGNEDDKNTDKVAEVVKTELAKAIKPLEERLTALENARGIGKSAGNEGKEEGVQKQEQHYLHGYL